MKLPSYFMYATKHKRLLASNLKSIPTLQLLSPSLKLEILHLYWPCIRSTVVALAAKSRLSIVRDNMCTMEIVMWGVMLIIHKWLVIHNVAISWCTWTVGWIKFLMFRTMCDVNVTLYLLKLSIQLCECGVCYWLTDKTSYRFDRWNGVI